MLVEEFLDPGPEVDAVFGQRPAVAFAGVDDPLHILVVRLDGGMEFFAVRDGHAAVVVAVGQQHRLRNARGLLHRRRRLELCSILGLIANHFGGLASVGVVDFASRLCQIPRTFIGSIGQTMVPAFARTAFGTEEEQRRLFDHSRAMIVPLSVTMLSATIGGAYLAGWIFIEQTSIDAALITAILAIGWLSNLVASTEYFMLFGRRNLRVLTLSHIVMVGGMVVLGFMGGQLGGFLGAITGAMTGVVISSWLLFVMADRPARAASSLSRPSFRQSLWLAVLTLLVLTGQLYMAATGIVPTWITAGAGTALMGLIVVILTPWNSLIAIAGTIDHVASSEAKECN